LGGNGGSEVFINVEAVDSVFEFSGGDAKRLGKGLPLRCVHVGKGGIAAPPDAACFSREVCVMPGIAGDCQNVTVNPPTIMPRMNGASQGLTLSQHCRIVEGCFDEASCV